MRFQWILSTLVVCRVLADLDLQYNEEECALDVSEMIDELANLGANIQFTLPDCLPAGFSILDCTSDILPVIVNVASFSKSMSKAVTACGDIDATCSVNLSESIANWVRTAIAIVAAASDCDMSNSPPVPLQCVVDIFTMADSLCTAIVKLRNSMDTCNPGKPSRLDGNDDAIRVGLNTPKLPPVVRRLAEPEADRLAPAMRTAEALMQVAMQQFAFLNRTPSLAMHQLAHLNRTPSHADNITAPTLRFDHAVSNMAHSIKALTRDGRLFV